MPDIVLQVADTVASNSIVKKSNYILRIIAIFILVSALVLSLSVVDVSSAKKQIVIFLGYVDSLGWIGPVAYALVHAFAVCVCFPATILFEFGAGFLYGLSAGVPLVVTAKALGACIAFLLGRTLLRNWVQQKVAGNDRFQNIYKNISTSGWRFAFLLRLSPVPSWVNNYGLALTEIKFSHFLLATVVGTIPQIAQHVYFGTMVQHAAMIGGDLSGLIGQGGWPQTVFMVVGFIATLTISRMLVKYGTTATRESTELVSFDAEETASNASKSN